MSISKRVKDICPSQTLAIKSKVLQLKDEGKNVISFGAGEPDFNTPDNIKNKAISAINNNFSHYTSASGIPELKRAIIEKLKRDNHIDYNTKEIIVSNGAKHSLFNALMTLCNPGDEVLLPSPCWVSYTEQIKLAQAIPVFIKTDPENKFRLSADQVAKKINSKTKVLLLNTPNNPTGSVYSQEELEKIARLVEENQIYCISDEIYEKLVYDQVRHVSLPSFGKVIKEKVIVINGVSKSYAMTGWRIGYAAGPEEIISGMSKLQGHSTSNANSIAQKASIEALIGKQDRVEEMRKEFDRRRKYIVNQLKKIKGFDCFMPEGAFYAFPNIKQLLDSGIVFKECTIKTSLQLADYILEKAQVAVVPGSAFEAEGYLRLSYATSMEDIQEGIERLKQLFN